jgi:hypothetical protein
MMMKEIVVYLKEDYSENESIFVQEELSDEQIIKKVDETFVEWYYYDIL